MHTPASQLPIARLAAEKVERELSKEGLDAEKLIAKWKPRVQAAKHGSRRADGEGRETGRLVMIGPASQGSRPSGTGAYDGRVPGESDEDGEDDDMVEEEEEEDDGDDHDDYEEAQEGRREAIEPSLRSQLATYSQTANGAT